MDMMDLKSKIKLIKLIKNKYGSYYSSKKNITIDIDSNYIYKNMEYDWHKWTDAINAINNECDDLFYIAPKKDSSSSPSNERNIVRVNYYKLDKYLNVLKEKEKMNNSQLRYYWWHKKYVIAFIIFTIIGLLLTYCILKK